jgi:SsrA-binding protein
MQAPIFNKKASFDYVFKDKLEAGISLTGGEVKSVRAGSMSLADSYIKIINGNAVLLNAFIAPYKMAIDPSYDPKRNRQLLLRKEQIDKLIGQTSAKNLTIVPVKVYIKRNLVKVEIALAQPKKKSDKRDELKKKAIKRETEKLLREDKIKLQKL